jgi:curved DNA-binding protein CbpA
MTVMATDHYTVLGVMPGADRHTIQTAYRAMARRYHPDFGGDEHLMARVNEAWRVLGDPERRAAYDGTTARPAPVSRETRKGRTILDFGRYQGWSLTEVANVDDDYLDWLGRTPLGRPLRAEIADVLAERSRLMDSLRPVAAPAPRRAWGRG